MVSFKEFILLQEEKQKDEMRLAIDFFEKYKDAEEIKKLKEYFETENNIFFDRDGILKKFDGHGHLESKDGNMVFKSHISDAIKNFIRDNILGKGEDSLSGKITFNALRHLHVLMQKFSTSQTITLAIKRKNEEVLETLKFILPKSAYVGNYISKFEKNSIKAKAGVKNEISVAMLTKFNSYIKFPGLFSAEVFRGEKPEEAKETLNKIRSEINKKIEGEEDVFDDEIENETSPRTETNEPKSEVKKEKTEEEKSKEFKTSNVEIKKLLTMDTHSGMKPEEIMSTLDEIKKLKDTLMSNFKGEAKGGAFENPTSKIRDEFLEKSKWFTPDRYKEAIGRKESVESLKNKLLMKKEKLGRTASTIKDALPKGKEKPDEFADAKASSDERDRITRKYMKEENLFMTERRLSKVDRLTYGSEKGERTTSDIANMEGSKNLIAIFEKANLIEKQKKDDIEAKAKDLITEYSKRFDKYYESAEKKLGKILNYKDLLKKSLSQSLSSVVYDVNMCKGTISSLVSRLQYLLDRYQEFSRTMSAKLKVEILDVEKSFEDHDFKVKEKATEDRGVSYQQKKDAQANKKQQDEKNTEFKKGMDKFWKDLKDKKDEKKDEKDEKKDEKDEFESFRKMKGGKEWEEKRHSEMLKHQSEQQKKEKDKEEKLETKKQDEFRAQGEKTVINRRKKNESLLASIKKNSTILHKKSNDSIANMAKILKNVDEKNIPDMSADDTVKIDPSKILPRQNQQQDKQASLVFRESAMIEEATQAEIRTAKSEIFMPSKSNSDKLIILLNRAKIAETISDLTESLMKIRNALLNNSNRPEIFVPEYYSVALNTIETIASKIEDMASSEKGDEKEEEQEDINISSCLKSISVVMNFLNESIGTYENAMRKKLIGVEQQEQETGVPKNAKPALTNTPQQQLQNNMMQTQKKQVPADEFDSENDFDSKEDYEKDDEKDDEKDEPDDGKPKNLLALAKRRLEK